MNSTKTKSLLILLIIAVICAICSRFFRLPQAAFADAGVLYAFDDSEVKITVDGRKVVYVEENLQVGFKKETDTLCRAYPAKINSCRKEDGGEVFGKSFIPLIFDISAEVEGKPARAEIDRNSGEFIYLNVYKPDGQFDAWEKQKDNKYNIKLKYSYDFADDKYGGDMFYYILFCSANSSWFYRNGDRDNCSQLTVTVEMPEEFTSDAVTFLSSGKAADCKEFKMDSENSFTAVIPFKDVGSYALLVDMPQNTFDPKVRIFWYYWLFVAMVFFIIVASCIVAYIYRGRKPLAPIEYSPPIINPVHFSAFWHGYARRKDICTLILIWANLGCITIKKDGNRDIILTKKKDLPKDRSSGEREYFNAFFKNGKVYRSKDTRGLKNWYSRLSIRLAVGKLMDEAGTPITYAKGVNEAQFIVMLSSLFTILLTFLYFTIRARNVDATMMLVFFGIVLCLVFGALYKTYNELGVLRYRFHAMYVTMLFAAFPIGIPIIALASALTASSFLPVYDQINLVLISFIWILFCMFVMPKIIEKRTEEAQAMCGKMLGFKKFLTLAKVPEMELMIQESPEFYLDVLPYCMIMGLSKKLDKKTEFVAAPEWADGFDAKNFATSLYSTVKRAVITRRKRVKHEKRKKED